MHPESTESICRAIENGANSLAEGFLFGVAALLILGETWRSSRSQSKRRDSVDDQLEELADKLTELTTRVEQVAGEYEGRWEEEKVRCVVLGFFTHSLFILTLIWQERRISADTRAGGGDWPAGRVV